MFKNKDYVTFVVEINKEKRTAIIDYIVNAYINGTKERELRQIAADYNISDEEFNDIIELAKRTWRIAERPYFRKKSWRERRLNKKGYIRIDDEPVKDIKEPVLFLMRNDGIVDVIENMREGLFEMDLPDGKGKKAIALTPDKLVAIKYGKDSHIKGWIAHEDNMMPYPQKAVYGAEMFWKIITKIAMNYRDAESTGISAATKRNIRYILLGILAVVIVTVLVKSFGGGADTESVKNITQQLATNASEAVKNVVLQ